MKRIFGVKFIFDMRGWWVDEKLESGYWESWIYKIIYNLLKWLEKKLKHLSDKELDALLLLADKEKQKDLEEKQKKAFSDPFMLAEKEAFKKRRDQWLREQDDAECGGYDRRFDKNWDDKGYY